MVDLIKTDKISNVQNADAEEGGFIGVNVKLVDCLQKPWLWKTIECWTNWPHQVMAIYRVNYDYMLKKKYTS